MSDTNRIHKCHCCGWEWVHGQYGGHDCSVKLQERIKELEGQLKSAYCGVVGSDSIVGLDCCDDYRNWIDALGDK